MARKTPQAQAALWKSRFAASAPAYTAGVMAVTEAPGIRAARAQELMKQKVIESIDSGRYAAAVSSISLNDWQQAAAKKGAQRLTSGAESGAQKYQQYAMDVAPVLEAVSQTVKSMPKGTTEDALARIRVNLEALKAFKQRRR